jgi:translocation and assembly module TamB
MRVFRYLAYVIAALAVLAGSVWFWTLHTTSGARWILGQVETAVGLEAASIEGDISGGLRLQAVRFTNERVDVAIVDMSASVDFDLWPLSLDVVAVEASDIDVVVYETAPDDETPRDWEQQLDGLVLPLPVRVSGLRATGLSIDAGDVEEEIDRVELVAYWHESIVVERLDVSARDLSASLRGALDLGDEKQFTVNVEARLPPELTRLGEALTLTASGNGDPGGVDYEARLGAIATADGSVRWQDELTAQASIDLHGLDLSGIVNGWPDGFPLAGRIRASLNDERLAVSDTMLEIVGMQSRLQVDASIDRLSEETSGHLRWEHLRWPLAAGEARVQSETGDLRLQGTIDNWTVDGSIALLANDLPRGRFVIAGAGTRDGVEGRIVDSNVFGGHASGEVAYSWVGARAWHADLNLRDVNLDALLPDWPTVMTGRVESRGTTEPLALQAELHDVSGKIRGLDILASGRVDYGADGLVARSFILEHGDSRVQLDGALAESGGLTFEAYIADVGVYAEDASGAVSLAGSASLAKSLLRLKAFAESPSLSIGDSEFTGLLAELEAADAGQSLVVNGAHRDTGFSLSVAGAFDDWSAPLQSRFEGAINGFQIDLGDEHAMVLRNSAPLAFSMVDASLREFCIADQTGGSLCSNATWERGGHYAVDLQLVDAPLTILEHVLDTGLHFDQHVGGSFNWHRDAAGAGGSGELRVSAGAVSPLEDPASRVATGDGRIDFEIHDGRLLRGDFDLPLPERGHVNGKFSLLDVTSPGNSEIAGELFVDIFNIRVLSRLLPSLDSASGALRARLAVAGTAAEPAVTGNLAVEEGRFVYRPIGLDVKDVNLSGSMDSDRRFELAGTFRAGDGYGELASRADYSNADEPGLHFSLHGRNLTLIDVPDVLIKIDPDIDVVLSPDTLTVNGEIVVPRALIKPTNFATGRISESEDVVIIAGELPDSTDEEQKRNGLGYQGELRVLLGDDITVDLDVAKAKITGDAAFDWQGDAIPIANGRYQIGGNIEAFGQVLEITEGTVQFPGVPADQPFIRIVAEREIFGNTAVRRAGVLIDGPIRRPMVQAYTVPLTTEERALTLLVTGSDFDYEQGVGAIDFGTYIAPRLFLSYGVGVFERENIISARFDLTKGFGIKASSGSKESGVDLNYRIER